ncbi:hypothetical protein ACN38_g2288 [Penicillium nordicum]|uniref:Uncharacterized protein n=1 Tax=Penicillium nordicum TaxID=229535 RepID=A0A0M8PEU8_9EURO|nr:hypothetical protein ACN38_g2288 [Penicillium nordicum]
MALGEPDMADFYNWGARWLFKASGVWEIARAWHATLMEIEAFYNRHRTSAENIMDHDHLQFLQLQDRVERLAESEASVSNQVPVEGNAQGNAQGSSTQQGRFTEPFTQDGPSMLSQEHSVHLEGSNLPSSQQIGLIILGR